MSKNILIIEDEPLVIKSLQKLLKKHGYSPLAAASGEEALLLLKKNDIDLIISDIRMPKMDGIETIKAIRNALKESGKAAVPEIFITGFADEVKYKDAVKLEVAEYIYKPFDREEILEAVKKHLGTP